MNATTILTLLTEGNTDKAIMLLKQEIAGNASANKNAYKARAKFAKQANKACKDSRPAMAGAYIDNDKQVIVDGYCLGVYNDIADGLIQAAEGTRPNIKQILPTSTNGYTSITVDLDRIAAEYKIAKAEKKTIYVKLGDKTYFNPDYLLTVISTFEKPVIYLDDSPVKPMYIKGDNGEGIIFPIRVVDESAVGRILSL